MLIKNKLVIQFLLHLNKMKYLFEKFTSKYEFFSILKLSAIFDVGLKTPWPVELILIIFTFSETNYLV